MHVSRVSSVVQLCVAVSIISSVVIVQVAARNENFEGNVHLVFDGTNNFEGVLQVYTQNNWNLVCYKHNGELMTNRGAASAACRQTGYTTAVNWNTSVIMKYNNPENTEPLMAISGIRCPYVRFALSEDEIFLLRCDNDAELIEKEQCDGFVGIQCDNTKPHDTNYNGKVSRTDDGDHTELLEIIFEGEKLPICTSYLSKTSADSACRQMGFTRSNRTIRTKPNNGKSWKIYDLSECDDNANASLPCFTDCIDRSLGYTLVDQCDENQYELICQFDKNTDGVFSAGDQFICTYPASVSIDALSIVSSLLSVIIGGLAILSICLCCCPVLLDNDHKIGEPFRLAVVLWKKIKRLRRNGYNKL